MAVLPAFTEHRLFHYYWDDDEDIICLQTDEYCLGYIEQLYNILICSKYQCSIICKDKGENRYYFNIYSTNYNAQHLEEPICVRILFSDNLASAQVCKFKPIFSFLIGDVSYQVKGIGNAKQTIKKLVKQGIRKVSS
jgi:hypothetical protein